MSFDPTKPCKTRSGLRAEVLRTDLSGDYPILAVIHTPNGILAHEFNRAGYCRSIGSSPPWLDLINTKPEMWVNLYDNGHWRYTGRIHDSYASAVAGILNKAIVIGTFKLVRP